MLTRAAGDVLPDLAGTRLVPWQTAHGVCLLLVSAGRLHCEATYRAGIRIIAGVLLALVAASPAARAQGPGNVNPALAESVRQNGHVGHADDPAAFAGEDSLRLWRARLERAVSWVVVWYRRTPPADRVTWSGMVACVALGFYVILERLVRLSAARSCLRHSRRGFWTDCTRGSSIVDRLLTIAS